MALDLNKIRADFPALKRIIRGKPVVYLDSACMSLKPVQVLEAMSRYYTEHPGCGGRSAHKFSTETSEAYHKARATIAHYLGAGKLEEIVFTRNTTEGINLVANCLDWKPGDVVITSDREHNSNLLPWLMLAKKRGIKHVVVESNPDGTFSMPNLKAALGQKAKLVSMVHSSNLDGYTLPAEQITKAAHDAGALVMLDAAQSAPHKPIDVRKLGVDFLAISGHKMLGPTGTGALYGKFGLLEKLEPFMVGGDTVSNTTYDSYTMLPPPEKFEAGLQNYAGAMGFGAAAEYLDKIGRQNIEKHELALNKLTTELIADVPGLHILGPQDPALRGGVISFTVDKINPHDIALMLDQAANIMIRSGMHCVHSWFNAHGIAGSARASLYLYNTEEEVRLFAEQLGRMVRTLI